MHFYLYYRKPRYPHPVKLFIYHRTPICTISPSLPAHTRVNFSFQAVSTRYDLYFTHETSKKLLERRASKTHETCV